MVQLLSSY
jgi:chaperonin GroEL (HSP60 family)